jgi:uroporphyrinogen decarboxylase
MDGHPLVRKRIYSHYGAEDHRDFYQKSGIDNFSLWAWPAYEPVYIGPPRHENKYHDLLHGIWGSTPQVAHPMAPGYTQYRWPSARDFDFSGASAAIRDAHSCDMVSIGAHISVGLCHHIRMRGYEQTMYDVLDDAFMEDYTGRIREYILGYLTALFDAAGDCIDIMRCDEDIGGNDTLLISPDLWRQWYKPLWREAFALCKARGSRIWLHSCGYCRPLVEDFIECGADVLDPVPPYVKDSDPADMKAAFGARLCLHGGVDQINQMIYGTPEGVRAEVKLRMEQMKPGGGYICGASQVLTEQIPFENVLAFFNAALEFGGYA